MNGVQASEPRLQRFRLNPQPHGQQERQHDKRGEIAVDERRLLARWSYSELEGWPEHFPFPFPFASTLSALTALKSP